MLQQNQTHLKYLEIKSRKKTFTIVAVDRARHGRWWGGVLAFGGRVLTQEGGDGAGFSDFLGQGALHVFDGWIGSRVQQELHDVGELARRRCQKTRRGQSLRGGSGGGGGAAGGNT